MKRLIALVLAVAAPALAYEGYEHRKISDRAAAGAFNGLYMLPPALASLLPDLPWRGTAGRWVTCTKDRTGSGKCDWFGDSNKLEIWIGPRDGRSGTWASFGDLVMVYGDHRDTVPGMLATSEAEFKRLRDAANTTGHTFSRLGQEAAFLHLAAKNATHFGSTAVMAYYSNHHQALLLAYQAVVKNDVRLMWEALHYEALAVHSLTDLFAPGHLFVDREGAVNLINAERAWETTSNPLGKLVAAKKWFDGAMGGVWDKYGYKRHDDFNEWGMQVKDLRHQGAWWTYGDAKYDKLSKAHAGKDPPAYAAEKSLTHLVFSYAMMLGAKAGKAPGHTAASMFKKMETHPLLYESLLDVPARFEKQKHSEGVFPNAKCGSDGYCDFPLKAVIEKLLGK